MSKITQIIKEARDQGRLTALDFAQGIFDDFIELHEIGRASCRERV